MNEQISEVKAQDFLSFSRDTPSYVKLEQTLIEIGGEGVKGTSYKMDVLNAAGWNYGKLISYGAHPEAAATAFNIIRNVLSDENNQNADSEQLITHVQNLASNKLH